MRRESPAPPCGFFLGSWGPTGLLVLRVLLLRPTRGCPRVEKLEKDTAVTKKLQSVSEAQPASNFSRRKHLVGSVLGFPEGRNWLRVGARQDLYFYPSGGPSIRGSGTSQGEASPAGRRSEAGEVWPRLDRPVLGPSTPRALGTRGRSKTCARGRDSAAVKSGLGPELCV